MKQLVFAVYDSKAGIFGTPIFTPTQGIAERSFTDQANRPDSAMCMHPGDFTLFHLGEYDVETGKLIPLETPKSIGLAQQFQRVE